MHKYLLTFVFLAIVTLCLSGLFVSTSPVQAKTPHITLSVTSVSAVDHHASHVSVKTLAQAALTITVLYLCSNHIATSKSLKGTAHADTQGRYTWVWTPDSKCRGNARATILAKEYGQAVAVQRVFSVA